MKKRKSLEHLVEDILKQLYNSYNRSATIDKYKVDFLLPNNKVIECYGDYWHCNPQRYSSTYQHRVHKMSAEAVWARDNKRVNALQSLGYQVLILWENEVKLQPHETQRKIKRFIKG
jgi:very-short-patch-repair endonuclease